MKRISLNIGERVLPSGLTAVAVQNRGVSTFAAGAALRVSQVDEADDEHGLAYLTGACLDEGTRKRSAIELAEATENIGGTLDASTSGR